MSGIVQWWGLVQNEWLKFRRRRRVWIGLGGLVVLTLLVTQSQSGLNPANTPAALAKSDRSQIVQYQAMAKQNQGAARLGDEANLLLARYDLAAVTGRTLPPMAPIIRATRRWTVAEARGHRAADGYGSAVTAYRDAQYAAAHHVELQPTSSPRSGWWLVSDVFSGTFVLLFGLLAVLLTADILGMESHTHTWNRLWLDPPPRGPLLLAKGVLALAAAVGVMVGAGVLLFAAGTVAFGAHAGWVVNEVSYVRVLVHYPSGAFQMPAILHARQVTPTSLANLDVLSVLGSLLPIAGVVAVAAALGYFIHQGTLATLLAAGFAAAPVLSLAGNVSPWIAWLPGSYLEFGRWLEGQILGQSALVVSVPLALGMCVAWVALACVVVAWHQRRVEV